MKCPYCGEEHPADARFCPSTGQMLSPSQESTCPSCGAPVQAEWPYCQSCGAPLHKRALTYSHLALMAAGVVCMLLGVYFTWAYFSSLPSDRDRAQETASWKQTGKLPSKEAPDLVKYSSDGKMFASVQGRRIAVYEAENMRLVTGLDTDAPVRSVQFSPAGDRLAAGLEDGRVLLWSLPDGALQRTLEWNNAAVLVVDFSPDGALLLIGDEDGILVVCKGSDGSKVHTLRLSAAVSGATFWGNNLAACDSTGECRIWEGSNLLRSFSLPFGDPLEMRAAPDGRLIFSTGQGFFVWQSQAGRFVRRLYTGYPHTFRVMPAGRLLLCGCGNALEIWDLVTGERVATYPMGAALPLELGITSNGGLRLVVLDGSKVVQWEQTASWQTVASPGESTSPRPPATQVSFGVQANSATPRPASRPSPRPTATRRPTPSPLPTATPVPVNQPLEVKTTPRDGAEIVLVPEGEFLMGSDPGNDPYFWGAEAPSHVVTVNTFWIYRTEVTNAMYQACVADHACPLPDQSYAVMTKTYYGAPAYADYPVIYVTYTDALAYCRWAGGRLPTEAEWEKAARGTDGILFPWGNRPPDARRANLCDRACARGEERENGFTDGYPGPAPVGSFPTGASPYGAFDMAGNVWEWTSDWFQAAYYQKSPYNNPRGPTSGSRRVIRGGGWNNPAGGVRTVARASMPPAESRDTIGFRCVIDNP